VQRSEVSHAQASLLFWLSAAIGCALMLVTALLAPAIAWFYGEPRLTPAALVLSGTFAASGLGVQHRAILRRQMRFTALAFIDLSALCIGIGVAIVMAWRGHGYWSLIAMLATSSGVTVALLWRMCPWRPALALRGADAGSLLRFGGRVSGFNLLNYFASHLDRLLLGWQWGAAALGVYSRAHQLMMLPLRQLNTPLSGVFVSTLSRLRHDPARYRRTYLGALEKISLVTTPAILFGIGSADWLIDLVLGPQWTSAAPIFAVLGVSALLMPIANTTGWLFVSQNRTRTLLAWGLLDAGVRTLAVVVGLRWGALGIATALSVRSLAVLPLLLWLTGREGPVSARDIARACRLPALVCAASALPLVIIRLGLPELGALPGLVLCAAGAAAAAAAVLGVAPAGRRVLADLRSSLQILTRPGAAA
jgi:PST family polysaccharide transporter